MDTGHLFPAILESNRQQAKRVEDVANQNVVYRYKEDHSAWVRNTPIRAALGLPVDGEPQPPQVIHITFDETEFKLVETKGPEVHQRLFPPLPPEPPPTAPGGYKMGPTWPDRNDVRTTSGALPPPGAVTKDETGQDWTFLMTPFGWGYWRRKGTV
jgi:hypothetical protein